jgi:hypothetical protein
MGDIQMGELHDLERNFECPTSILAIDDDLPDPGSSTCAS